jgi:hypothetical protein
VRARAHDGRARDVRGRPHQAAARDVGRLARRPGRLRPGWCGDLLGIPTPLCPVWLCL